MPELFLTSMFRSGSTTLSRALNAHRSIAFASDPYLEVLKLLRSDIAANKGLPIPFMAPLGDYFSNPTALKLLNEIENADPELPFTSKVWDELHPVLTKRCDAYSKNLIPYLDNIKGSTYAETLSSALQQIENCYGDDETIVTGFKEVWATEFIPFFLNSFPQGKAIILQRDPRAVCASNNRTNEKYPWIFLCRQWRKLAALGWSYAHDEKYSERVFLLNFEDFVASPEKITKDICKFLDIEWDAKFADASAYKGGGGEPWKQNTSFGAGVAGFDVKAGKRWKEQISSDECAYIEYMCEPEMSLHGYASTEEERGKSDYWIKHCPRIKDTDQANWMRKLVPNDRETLTREMEKEKARDNLLLMEKPSSDWDLIERAFLKKSVYREIFQITKKTPKARKVKP